MPNNSLRSFATALAVGTGLVGLLLLFVLLCKGGGLQAVLLCAGWLALTLVAAAIAANAPDHAIAADEHAPKIEGEHRRHTAWLLVVAGLAAAAMALVTVILLGGITLKPNTRDRGPQAVSAVATPKQPIVWAQLRPDSATATGELIARAIVPANSACPTLRLESQNSPEKVDVRTDGADPEFPVKMCEAAIRGDVAAKFGDVTLKPRPRAPKKIVVIGDTGCRVTDYIAQSCKDDWPFARVERAAAAMHPDLVIHVGDYHYREKPCAGRKGCDGPFGDNWGTWDAELFTPAAPLLTAAPWLMLRGNHEDCTRAGAGWNLLIRPMLGLKKGDRCPADVEPDVFTFDKLRMIVPDTASAELDYGRDVRASSYRNDIRRVSKELKPDRENWLVTHQALLVSYGQKNDDYGARDLFTRLLASPDLADKDLRRDLCKKTISPMHAYRQWLDGTILETNADEDPCVETKASDDDRFLKPEISLILSGDTHTFQMFASTDDAKGRPLQLVVGNGGDVLERGDAYPGADKKMVTETANLFGVTGKLWMRNTFGFAVLERPDETAAWTAKLYDVDGKKLMHCELKQPGADCTE